MDRRQSSRYTYGDRMRKHPPDYAAELAEVCRETFSRGGNLVIPAFSVGRTQEMLFFMRKIKTENLLPEFADFEVYIDSPLAVEATNIFHKNVEECFRDRALDLILTEQPDLLSPAQQMISQSSRHLIPYKQNRGIRPPQDEFAELVERETGVRASAPYSGDIYDLAANAYRTVESDRHRLCFKWWRILPASHIPEAEIITIGF